MLFQKLHAIIENFESQTQQQLCGYMKSFDLILSRMSLYQSLNEQLKEIEHTYEFENIDEEIRYFKFEKPQFQKYGIFYNTLIKTEKNVPIGSLKIKMDYYEGVFEKLHNFFKEHQEIVVYSRMKRTDKDNVLFIKNSSDNYIFAVIEASIMMEEFLNKVNDPRSIDEKINDFPKFIWTDSLAKLVLLVKGLVLSKSINNGNVTTKELVAYFQVMFNVDLKDHYRKYQDIKNSQDPTKFLDYLIELIKKDIDESDEKLIRQRKK